MAMAGSAIGQTVYFRTQRTRVTVPLNSTNSTVITNLVHVTGLGGVPVDFSVTGLPDGAGVTLTDTNGTPLLSTLDDTNLCVTLNTTNIAEGVYTFSLNGTGGATNSVALVLQAAHVWNGQIASAGPWSQATNWLTGVPAASSDVVFMDSGTQTNNFTNSIVDSDVTIASLRFAQTGVTNDAAPDTTARPTTHTIQIATGKTLSVTGTNGFRFLRDNLSDNSPNSDFPPLYGMAVNIGGTNAALVVSNDNANFALTIEAQAANTLDMSTLARFNARVNRVGLGDYSLYPNFWSYDANGYNGIPRRFIPTVNLARTNVVTALWADPNNYTNAEDRLYSMAFVGSVYSGTTTIPVWNLGITNVFLMDSVCLVGANQQGTVQFNPAFAPAIPCYAYFRSTNNGRMSMFAISDDAGTNYSGSNIKSFINFGGNGGSVDILTDRFYMTRDRELLSSDGNFQGQLYMGKGIIDANTAILGYQQFTNRSTNVTTYRGWCQASITVSNTAVFKVNNALELGYATETAPLAEPDQNRGVINIGPGGTVRAGTILFGGPTKASSGSAINMSGGATLIVSNTIAGPDGALPSLNMSDSVLVLNLNGANTDPYVYVTNLVCGGLTNQINLASITGVTSYPTQYALIKYTTASANFSAKIPAGQFGFVLNNTANSTIDVYLFTNAPKSLVWRGNNSADWDTTTANWVLSGTTTPATFSQGDIVAFDDTALNTAVNVVGGVFPGQITVNNTTKNFSFSGAPISGTAKAIKLGTGKLTFNGPCENSLALTNGTVEVGQSGSIGSVTAVAGTVFTNAGTAFGLTSLGTAYNGGAISGPVTINAGVFVNSSYINTRPGTLFITNSIMTNTADGVIDVAVGNWTVENRATLANFGTVNNLNGRLNVNSGGVLFGTGSVIDPNSTAPNPDGRTAINAGALLSPGAAVANSIGAFTAGGRFDLNIANGVPAKLLVEVDLNNPQVNDVVAVDLWNNMLGMIVMTNIDPAAGGFKSGQTFLVVSNNNGPTIPFTPDVANQMPIISPPMPGPGLHWQLASLRTNGVIGVTNSLIWRGNVSGDWDSTTANWAAGALYSDGNGVLFDDSASGATVVNLTTSLAPGANPNDTNNPLVMPALIISNAVNNYTFTGAGRISGRGGLYKTGPGTLTINIRSNDYSGPTVIDGGVVEVPWLAGWNQVCSLGNQGSGGTASGNRAPIFLDGSTLRYLGTNTATDRHVFINSGGATLDVSLATTILTNSGRFSGLGGLTKAGLGAVHLSDGNNNYAGATTVSAGVLRVAASGAASTNTINLAGGGLQYAGGGFSLNNPINIAGSGSSILVSNANNVSGGAWSGSGDVALANTGQFTFNASLSGFSGAVSFGNSTGSFRFNNATNKNDCLGSAAASFDLGTGTAALSNLNGGNLTYDLGALSGGPNTVLAGRSSNTVNWAARTVYSIGANGSNTVFNGRILDGLDVVSVTKVGSGTLLLNGNNGYTGATTVSAGTLGGTGTFLSPVTVQAGGTLAPGTSIGTMAISNSLTLGGTLQVEVSRNGGALNNDKIVGLTSVTFGGSLVVSNIGPDSLMQGHSFQLFSTGGAGNFSSITPPLTGGLSWSFDPTTGILSVAGPQPQLTFGRSGGNIVFSWAGTGFRLQAQTNAITTGISNNWSDYPGGGTSPVVVPIDAANGTVFFRLSN